MKIKVAHYRISLVPLPKTTPPSSDELDKAIEPPTIPHYNFENVVSEQGKNGLLWTLFETTPFASRRVATFATEADARYFIKLCAFVRDAAKQSREFRKLIQQDNEIMQSMIDKSREQRELIKKLVEASNNLLRMDSSYPLNVTADLLVQAVQILLNEKSYDGDGHERLAIARNYATMIPNAVKFLNEALSLAHAQGFGKDK